MAADLSGLEEIVGFLGGCLVDSETGLMLGAHSDGSIDMEAAGAVNTEVIKAKMNAIKTLDIDDEIDDILITLGKQYHLIRPVKRDPSLFLYVAFEKAGANVGLARMQVKKIEQTIAI